MKDFIHLHVHTQYSILDGACSIAGLISKAKDNGMKSLAITDHGNLFGAKIFYNEAKRNGIKPILGCEVYVAKKSRKDKKDKEDRYGDHLILLAKNEEGYKNLIKLVSYSWIEGHYYKPRIDKELLAKYNQGLIVSTACLAGEIPEAITNGDQTSAEKSILEFKELFGEDFYLELQRHKTGNPEIDNEVYNKQEIVNGQLIEYSKKHKIKLIATNDVHFINSEDAEAHDRLICLSTGTDIEDTERLSYTKQEYFKTPEEMYEIFNDIPEALENTLEIADKIEKFKLNRNPVMPDFPLPSEFYDEDEYLKHLTYEGAKQRYDPITDEIKKRIDFELSVIKKMGFPGYFLIVQDFLHAAREMGVSVGPGRGSAAGSVVAYCNKITDINPLKYNLLFERFLNPDRISLPDIDIDFDEDGREDVLNWVVKKYGKDRVAQIITFGTMAAKMAIRDVARVQKLSLNEADRLAKLVPERPGITLSKAYKEVKELEDARNSNNELIVQTLQYAETLEGSVRHTGLHACGIIIGRDNLIEHLPICTSKDSDLYVTQYDGKYVEEVGMLKMDFLGLKTLSIIKDTIEFVKEYKNIDIDIDNIPLDDSTTFTLYSKGETTGIFQFESHGMRKHLKELKPNRFEDLIAMNALYRPGPMEYIPKYINRKYNKEPIKYELPIMEKYLKDTYGITVYQEQVMQLSQEMAGFSGGEADSLRIAMGKKKKKLMDELYEKFVDGCKRNNIEEKIISQTWNDWEAFAQYAFNKSHSTCYAYISYQTAYLKAHYPEEFMAAVLSRNINDIKKITIFMDECKRMNISVFGPDVNESNIKFTVTSENNIRFGLGAIKGVGEGAALKIIQEKTDNGHYKNIFDFVERVNLSSVNKKNIEGLVMSGAFDSFSEIRREHFFAVDNKDFSFIENLIKYGNKIQNEKNTSQISLFGDKENFDLAKPEIPKEEGWSKLEKLNKEKDVIGIYLSAHPLDDYRFEIAHFCNTTLSDLQDLQTLNGKELTFAAIVTAAKNGTTKTGKPFGSLTLQDYTDNFQFAIFSSDYINFSKYFAVGYSLLVKGRVQPNPFRNEELEFKVKSITILSEVKNEFIKSISLKIPLSAVNNKFIKDLKQLSETYKGKILLKFYIYDPDENMSVNMFSRNIRINLSNTFLDFLENIPDIELKVN